MENTANNITVKVSDLCKMLEEVKPAVSKRSTLPILSAVCLTQRHGYLTVQGTDLETSVRAMCPVEGLGECTFVIPFSDLLAFVKPFKKTTLAVYITVDLIALGNGRMLGYKSLNAEDFPRFPEVTGIERFTIRRDELAGIIKGLTVAASKDESRAILTAVNLDVSDDTLTAVTTDSYRLFKTTTPALVGQAGTVNVPAVALSKWLSAVKTKKAVTLTETEHHILLESEGVECVIGKIEGTFPNYQQLIPKEFATQYLVDSKTLADLAKTFGKIKSNEVGTHSIGLVLIYDGTDTLVVKMGEMEATVPIMNHIGEPVTVSVNYQYLAHALAFVGDPATVSIQSSTRPVIIENGSHYTLNMPVRLG